MTLINRHPRTFSLAFILIALLILPLQAVDAAKRRHENNARGKNARRAGGRAERGKKLSARERRAARRNERLSARDSRRGGRSRATAHLSRRELRRLMRRDRIQD